MSPVVVLAYAAISALGRGAEAVSSGAAGAVPVSGLRPDTYFDSLGLRQSLTGRVAALADDDTAVAATRAERLLKSAGRELATELDRVIPGWRRERVGLILGTSAGGLESFEMLWEHVRAGREVTAELARRALYFGPELALDQALGVEFTRRSTLLSACISGTLALGLACRWLELDDVDWVIAGGYDALNKFVAAGFEALGATTRSAPNPFRSSRDGMALGEGVGLVCLGRAEHVARRPSAPVLGYILGFGAASDAHHPTAPEPSGRGLVRAAERALADAELEASAVDWVSAHATSTKLNDSAEAQALGRILPVPERVTIQPYKAAIGHTLGAAGALESLAAFAALGRGLLPGALGEGPIDTEFRARLSERNSAEPTRVALKLSSAFGGTNAALVLGARAREASRARPRAARVVQVNAVGTAQTQFEPDALRQRTRISEVKLSQLDELSGLAVMAVCDLLSRVPEPAVGEATAVVVGSAAATLEANAQFYAQIAERGVRGAEPRRFPATSPNLCAGQCSIAFGLHGPALSVGSDAAAAIEALSIALDWVAAGDAEQALVVAAEVVGDTTIQVWERLGWPLPRHGAVAVLLTRGADGRGVDSARLAALHAEVRAGQGQLRGASPGFPALLRVLSELTKPVPETGNSEVL